MRNSDIILSTVDIFGGTVGYNTLICCILGEEIGYDLLVYAWKILGIKPSDLGISNSYANMILNRKRKISEELLLKILERITAKDLLEYLVAISGLGPVSRRSSAWLERRPGKAEVPGSNPGGGSKQ